MPMSTRMMRTLRRSEADAVSSLPNLSLLYQQANMALFGLNMAATDSQDYKITFPETLKKDFGFTFPKLTATSTMDSTTFSTGSDLFMGSSPTLKMDNRVITSMSPGIIRDIVRQFVDGSGDRMLPLTSRRAIPFDILMVNDKTGEVFRMQPGSDPAKALNSKSRADRDAVDAFFGSRSLLPPANEDINLNTDVQPYFRLKANVGDLFLRVTTSEDFSMPSTWSPEDWTSFIVTCRLGNSFQPSVANDEPGFDDVLQKKFGTACYRKKEEVRGSPNNAPKYEPPPNTDLLKWIEFVLHVRDPDWNALYMRRIGLVFCLIGARLLVFTVDKNINMISCMCTSADVIKYNNDLDSASLDNLGSLKTMLKTMMGSLLDQHVLDQYDLDTGNRMIGGWQSANNTYNVLPNLSEIWPAQNQNPNPNRNPNRNPNAFGVDDDLARKSFETLKNWMSVGGVAALGDLQPIRELVVHQRWTQNCTPAGALLILLNKMAKQLHDTCNTGGSGGSTLQDDVDAAEKSLSKSKPGTPGYTHWDTETKSARKKLATNLGHSAVVARHIYAATDFEKSIEHGDPSTYNYDAAIALRNSLIDVDPVLHSSPKLQPEGVSAILLLHAFLMYFFDISGVRSPGRNWDAVKPKSAQDVTRMFIELLDIPA